MHQQVYQRFVESVVQIYNDEIRRDSKYELLLLGLTVKKTYVQRNSQDPAQTGKAKDLSYIHF